MFVAAFDGFPWNYVLIGGLAAAVIRYIWNAIAWMCLPHHKKEFRSFGAAPELEAALEKADLQPGFFYNLPHFKDFPGGMKDKDLEARMNKGPNAMIVPLPKGNCITGAMFLKGFLLNLVEGLVLAIVTLVLWTNNAIPIEGCLQTVLATAVLGVFMALVMHGAHSIWMLMPWIHTRNSILDGAIGYALMGGALYGVASML